MCLRKRSEEGQDLVEYTLILVLVAAIVIMIYTLLFSAGQIDDFPDLPIQSEPVPVNEIFPGFDNGTAVLLVHAKQDGSQTFNFFRVPVGTGTSYDLRESERCVGRILNNGRDPVEIRMPSNCE